jgi:hypothetical protein
MPVKYGAMNDTERTQTDEAGEDVAGPAPSESGTHPADVDDNAAPREIGGRKGPDPVRYGDWEKNGRCIDF